MHGAPVAPRPVPFLLMAPHPSPPLLMGANDPLQELEETSTFLKTQIEILMHNSIQYKHVNCDKN